MTTPRLAMDEIATAQDNVAPHNNALQVLDILVQSAVIDKDLATPPGSPASGDLYIVASSPTGAWVGHTNHLAYYRSGWVFVVPFEGLAVYVKDEDLRYVYDGSAWVYAVPLFGSAYDFGASFEATPTASQVVGRVQIGRNITVPADMAGASGAVQVNPTATFAVDVQDDGVSIGTISVNTSGFFTFTTAGGTAKSIAAGSVVKFIAPGTVDTTVAGFSAVLLATVA